MEEAMGKEQKKEVMKDIIRKLHQGMSAEAARSRFEKEIGEVTSAEITEIEQSLINEGISPDEIKKFCNVHALIFESNLGKSVAQEESPAHPIYLSKLENREVEKITGAIKEMARSQEQPTLAPFKQKLGGLLAKLQKVETHCTRKEQVLFPYPERAGFFGPSNSTSSPSTLPSSTGMTPLNSSLRALSGYF